MARQFTQGYLGLQTHGGNDRISYREIQVKEFQPSDIPVNTAAPTVTGSGLQGEPLTCNHGTWNAAAGSTTFYRWYRANKIPAEQPAPARADAGGLRQLHQPARRDLRQPGGDRAGFADRRFASNLHADRRGRRQERLLHGQRRQRRRDGVEVRGGAGDPVGDARRRLARARTVPATLALTLGTPATFGAFTPGVAKDYDASTTANVISTAGDAPAERRRPEPTATGHLVNGTFSLPRRCRRAPRSAAGTGSRAGRRRRQRRAD